MFNFNIMESKGEQFEFAKRASELPDLVLPYKQETEYHHQQYELSSSSSDSGSDRESEGEERDPNDLTSDKPARAKQKLK